MDTKAAMISHADPGTEEALLSPSLVSEATENSQLTDSETANKIRNQRAKQVDALAMRGPKKPKSKDSWLNTVGKYPEDAPLNRVLDEGAKIRETERLDPC